MSQIEEFLNGYARIKENSSWNSNRSHLRDFFKTIGKDPSNYIDNDFDDLGEKEKNKLKKEYGKDVQTFYKTIKGRPPNSQTQTISAVRKFFQYFDVNLRNKVWLSLELSQYEITEKKTPNGDELKFILENSSIKHKALFMIAATSGMRIHETVNITFDDIDIENRIIRVRDEIAKKDYPRTTFFTEEAQQYLKRWLDVREHYLKTKTAKSKYERDALEKQGYEIRKEEGRIKIYKGKTLINEVYKLDKRIFPFDEQTGRAMWNNLLEKAGSPFNEKDFDDRFRRNRGYYKYNQHCLRRFFNNCLRGSGISDDFRKYMVGHDPKVIKQYTDDNQFALEVKKHYDKHANALSVFSDAGKIKSELDPKIESHERHINRLKIQNEELAGDLKDFKEKYKFVMDGIVKEHDIQENEHFEKLAKEKEDTNKWLKESMKVQIEILKKQGVDTSELEALL